MLLLFGVATARITCDLLCLNLQKLSYTTAWIKYVSKNTLDYSDQEAVIYLISRGYNCVPQTSAVISHWKTTATRIIKAALSAKYIYDVDTGRRKLSRKPISEFNKEVIFQLSLFQIFGSDTMTKKPLTRPCRVLLNGAKLAVLMIGG